MPHFTYKSEYQVIENINLRHMHSGDENFELNGWI